MQNTTKLVISKRLYGLLFIGVPCTSAFLRDHPSSLQGEV